MSQAHDNKQDKKETISLSPDSTPTTNLNARIALNAQNLLSGKQDNATNRIFDTNKDIKTAYLLGAGAKDFLQKIPMMIKSINTQKSFAGTIDHFMNDDLLRDIQQVMSEAVKDLEQSQAYQTLAKSKGGQQAQQRVKEAYLFRIVADFHENVLQKMQEHKMLSQENAVVLNDLLNQVGKSLSYDQNSRQMIGHFYRSKLINSVTLDNMASIEHVKTSKILYVLGMKPANLMWMHQAKISKDQYNKMSAEQMRKLSCVLCVANAAKAVHAIYRMEHGMLTLFSEGKAAKLNEIAIKLIHSNLLDDKHNVTVSAQEDVRDIVIELERILQRFIKKYPSDYQMKLQDTKHHATARASAILLKAIYDAPLFPENPKLILIINTLGAHRTSTYDALYGIVENIPVTPPPYLKSDAIIVLSNKQEAKKNDEQVEDWDALAQVGAKRGRSRDVRDIPAAIGSAPLHTSKKNQLSSIENDQLHQKKNMLRPPYKPTLAGIKENPDEPNDEADRPKFKRR